MNVYAVPPAGSQPAPVWGAPPPSAPQRLGGLATALTVLLAIIAVFAVPMAAVLFYRASLLQGVLDGTTLDLQAAQAVDAVVAIVSVLYGILFVATCVVFVIWQYRHGKNARLLGPPLGLGPGWAIGGWFVPFANYVLPAMQVFGASRFADPAVVGTPNARGRAARIVIPWAIVFGLGSTMVFVNAVVAVVEPSGSYEESVRRFAAADQIGAVGQLLMVVAAILAIVMVRSLSSRQERTLDARAGVGPAISDARAAYGSAPWQPSGQAWGSAPAQPGTPWTQPGAAQPNPYVAPGDAAPAAPPVPPVTPPPMPSAPPAPPA